MGGFVPGRVGDKNLAVCLRGLFFFAGFVGAIWSALSAPQFWSAAQVNEVTTRIIADDRFKVSVLDDQLRTVQTEPTPFLNRSSLARSKAILRVRVAEESSKRRSPQEADKELTAADEQLRGGLLLNPTDSFLWLTLYSIEIARNGFNAEAVELLSESYATAESEGWISLRRNSLSLSAFPNLSETLKSKVISEFASLVDSDFVDKAAINLMRSGWEHRDRLLAGLANVNAVSREAFAKRLWQDGIDLGVPGVEWDRRQWR